MAGLGFGGAEVWGGGVEGGEDGGGEGREGEGGGAGGCSEECHRVLEWRGEVKVQPSLSPPWVTFHISTVESPHPSGPDGDTRTLPLPMPMSTPRAWRDSPFRTRTPFGGSLLRIWSAGYDVV